MARLTDSQLLVLSKAAARDDGAAIAPPKMNNAVATKLAASLVARKLMREVRSKAGMPGWRKNDDGRLISLVITRAGRDAIGVIDDEAALAISDAAGPPARERKPGRQKIGAIVGAPTTPAKSQTASESPPAVAIARPRLGSKQALVTDMLSQADGATLDAIVTATGWLPHTARAALTRLRKHGFTIEREPSDGAKTSHYRILGNAKNAA